jgi:hexosaminidase
LRLHRNPDLPPEGYRLRIDDETLTVEASTETGVVWATQTLRQLLGVQAFHVAPLRDEFELPRVLIEDSPRFGWRGVMLDVARHFRPLADVFRFVDLLSLHKHNVFHLHLTDDQGWRFASDRYPALKEVASWRAETWVRKRGPGDGTPHGGYYTADQLRALVRYAGDRGVTIVPELEFPGHVRALLAAYPELGNSPQQRHDVASSFGIFPEVLSLRPASLAVVFDLYEELLDIFPSRYIHIGGDECEPDEWLASPEAADLAAQRGLAGPGHSQRWFTEQLRRWLADRDRRMVGWDEIGDHGPVPGAVVAAWRDRSYGIAAAAAGNDVVMAPLSHTYLDYYPSEGADEPYAIGGLVTTETVYGFDPLEAVPAADTQRILGTQCQLWTEYLSSTRRLDYAMFPRACAHAEVAWSEPAGRDWAEFSPRLRTHLERLSAMGVEYRPEEGPRPWQRGGTGASRRQ